MLQAMNADGPSSDVADAAGSLATHLVTAFKTLRTLRPELPVQVSGLDHGALPLLYILDSGTHRVSSLADACHADLSTTSRYASTLAKLGLVEKTPDEHDRRAQVLVITEAGREVVRETREQRRELFVELLADWSAEDLHRFDGYLTRFADDVERRVKSPTNRKDH